ncbi:MAG: class I SAM-dependent methyltransferase [Candidatus Pacebacteria bacterium]|nr:class I SAM-dependent methyltransferase [Candidatus Paceibacterota bacterium]
MNPIEGFRLVRQKGFRLVFANFRERILFDAFNGIDTITQVSKDQFTSRPANLGHGLHYSSSWTSEIRFGFGAALKYLGSSFEDYTFIDIGCGKAKVQIAWEQLLRKRGLIQNVLGIDYYDALLGDANSNYQKVLGKDGHFIHADASEVDYPAISTKLIAYLYNPFDGVILARLSEALRPCSVVLIYNNPEHADVLLRSDFQIVTEKPGFHPQGTTIVYARASNKTI